MAKIKLKKGSGGAVAPTPGPKGKGGGDLMDLFVRDFAQTMGRVGDLAAATRSGWNISRVTLWSGYAVEAALPVTSLIEADALEVMEKTVRVAGNARPAMRKHLKATEGSHDKGSLRLRMGRTRFDPISDRDFLVYAVRQVMIAQGWNEIIRHKFWSSPSWLFPQIKLPFAELEAMILEEVDHQLGYGADATVGTLALGLAEEDYAEGIAKQAEKAAVIAQAINDELSDVDTGVLDHEPVSTPVVLPEDPDLDLLDF